jgi:predicted DNA-binding protein (UPF0251 family)
MPSGSQATRRNRVRRTDYAGAVTAAEIRRLAVAVLTPKQLEAYELVVASGFTERSAAKALGISRSSLRDRLEGADLSIARAAARR